jgi:hypothetical protein
MRLISIYRFSGCLSQLFQLKNQSLKKVKTSKTINLAFSCPRCQDETIAQSAPIDPANPGIIHLICGNCYNKWEVERKPEIPDWFGPALAAAQHQDEMKKWPWYGRLIHRIFVGKKCKACCYGRKEKVQSLLLWEKGMRLMKTNKTRFFKLLRKAALQDDQPVPEKSPRRSGDCNGKRTTFPQDNRRASAKR